MLGGEHTVRSIIERVRLPVNVCVPSRPPRNPYDRHAVREGHRYKLLNIVSKTVVLCLVLRRQEVSPSHFLLLRCMPRFNVAEASVHAAAVESLLLRHTLDPDAYSRAVRETRPELECMTEECVSPRRSRLCVSGQDSLAPALQHLSMCGYGGSDADSQSRRCSDSLGERLGEGAVEEREYVTPDWTEAEMRSSEEIPYEELWTNQNAEGLGKEPSLISFHSSSSLDGSLGTMVSRVTTPPPIPPKSDAVSVSVSLLSSLCARQRGAVDCAASDKHITTHSLASAQLNAQHWIRLEVGHFLSSTCSHFKYKSGWEKFSTCADSLKLFI